MGETVKDWIEKWKTDCGTVKEPDDVLLVMKENEKEIYVGHFLDVPEVLFERPVLNNSRICESSDPRRKDAYVLEAGRTLAHRTVLEHIHKNFAEGSVEIEDVDALTLKVTDKFGDYMYFKFYCGKVLEFDELPKSADERIKDASGRVGKDTYLESLYSTLEVCDMVLQNSQTFSQEHIQKAQKLRKETQEYIHKREAIPVERRI